MSLEVRIPVSPRPEWINRVHLTVASIRRFYPDAFFRISVSPERDMSMDFPRIPGVTWKVVARDRFNVWAGTRSEYLETMMDRYTSTLIGDHILMLDGDVLCTNRFDELFEIDAISGVQAHVPPFGMDEWRYLFRSLDLPEPALFEHSGWGTMVTNEAQRYSPAYLNSGVVFGPRDLFERLQEPYAEAVRWLRSVSKDSYWFDQVGLCIGVAEARIPVNLMDRYNRPNLELNFPNQRVFDEAWPDKLADVRFIHYLRTDVVHRDDDFADVAALRRLVARADLTGSNEVLRQHIAGLMGCLESPHWSGEPRNMA